MPAAVESDTLAPPFGQLEKPPRCPDAGIRVDFEAQEFDHAIANHGYRMVWTRRAECPCSPVDYQLTQPNPNCSFCSGTGYLYFGPSEPQDLSEQSLTPVQHAAVTTSGGFLLYALMMPLSSHDKRNDRLGTWMMGQSTVSVMSQNRLGFRDRLVNIDALFPYTEVGIMPAPPNMVLPLRYLVSGGVYLCQSEKGTRYQPGVDYVVDTGRLTFVSGRQPDAGTRVSVFYLTFPVWLVEAFNHRDRLQPAVDAQGRRVSPEGRIQRLPIQASVSLEFIPSDTNAAGG